MIKAFVSSAITVFLWGFVAYVAFGVLVIIYFIVTEGAAWIARKYPRNPVIVVARNLLDRVSGRRRLESYNHDLKPFKSPFDVMWKREHHWTVEPYTLLELRILGVLGEVKDKPGWREKVLQREDVLKKWRIEFMENEGGEDGEERWHRVVEELRYWAKKTDGWSMCPGAVDGVWISDHGIDEALHMQLKQDVHVLENVENVDFHPGSNNQVIDLVHPSLYPFVAGLTREVSQEDLPWEKFIGGGQVKKAKLWFDLDYDKNNRFYSKTYQWLPSEVDVSRDGRVRFASYINNLHPHQHAKLYGTIEKVLEHFVPMFNQVLSDLQNPPPKRVQVQLAWRGKNRDNPTNEIKLLPFDETSLNSRPTIELRGRRLQVIVKMANIVLTPDNPSYKGGAWHVEGMKNEQIVASGIFYWHVENITESKLAFRVSVDEPDYEQNDEEFCQNVYGLADEQALCQVIGAVTALEGRAVAWPNVLQHRVMPFELVDKTKPGFRKILVFFLVDPSRRIMSTSLVPPQQQSWMRDAMERLKPIPGLPHDLQGHIAMQNDWFFPHELALDHRLKLMHERKYLEDDLTQRQFERPFSLCEH